MKNLSIAVSMAVILMAFTTSKPAYAEGCLLEGVILNCQKSGSSSSDIMSAFASKETQEELAYPLSRKINFKQNGDLEKYRSSMEKNWRMITRYARQQERRKNSRRMSEAAFQTWAEEFAEAEKSYAIALNFYRQLHWQGVK